MTDPTSLTTGALIGVAAAGAVKDIVNDLAGPAAKEIGAEAGRGVRSLIDRAKLRMWGPDQAEEFLRDRVEQLMTPEEAARATTPPARILGPVIAGVVMTDDALLREVYANLLRTSMLAPEAAHPAFADVIRQLTSDEARIMAIAGDRGNVPTVHVREQVLPIELEKFSIFATMRLYARDVSTIGLEAGVEFPHRTPFYLSNLERLGLLMSLAEPTTISGEETYKAVESLADVRSIRNAIEAAGKKADVARSGYWTTEFGDRFYAACVPKERAIPLDISARLNEHVIEGLIHELPGFIW